MVDLGRTRPVLGTSVLAALVVAAPVMGEGDGPATLVFLLGLVLSYSCGAYGARWSGLAAVVALAVATQIRVGFADAPNLEIAVSTLAPWWWGLQVRRRRDVVHALAARTRELEAEEETFVALSVQRERARIARDLHDIVSHHVAVMVIQAGAGRLAEPWSDELAAGRLASIREAGEQALGEADRLVTMLQADAGDTPRLEDLLAHARRSGAHVVISPAGLVLAPEVEAIAYRVAQEALTNAMKHAPGAAVDVEVALSGDELVLVVRNEPAVPASALAATGSGLGLAGMRERLAGLGGSLAAGPGADGGFELRARMPS